MTSFTKVYNDVLGREKPQTFMRYFPTEVRIAELLVDDNHHSGYKLQLPF